MKDPEPTTESERTTPPTTAERETGAADPSGAPRKPRYEFKILPADPKNSFDFEDVADK